jgi:hypothetical protein
MQPVLAYLMEEFLHIFNALSFLKKKIIYPMLSTAYFYFDLSFHLPECYLSILHLEASGEHLINKKITSCFALHEYRLIVMRRHIERPAPASARLRQKAFNPKKKAH